MSQPRPIEEYSTKELAEEIAKRHDRTLIIAEQDRTEDGGSTFHHAEGSPTQVAGLAWMAAMNQAFSMFGGRHD